jgi:cytochrome c
MRNVIAGMALLALAACGSEGSTSSDASEAQSAAESAAESGSPTQVAAADAAPQPAGTVAPASFASCKACHAVQPGEHGVGPSLAGVHGTKAGSAAGYTYSAANRASGVTWDDATLDAYLTAPAKAMPGTKMTYAGMADPAKRKELIDYLRTLK